jgi:hypothetical protein
VILFFPRSAIAEDDEMGQIATAHSAYDWWQSFGAVGLASEFLAAVVVTFMCLWFTSRTRSAVFWKRTDYAYFLFVIAGGAVGAVDLAVSNWTKQLDQIELNLITEKMLFRGYISTAIAACDKFHQIEADAAKEAKNKAKEAAKERELFGPGVIKPSDLSKKNDMFGSDTIKPYFFPSTESKLEDLFKEDRHFAASTESCKAVERIAADAQEDTLKEAGEYESLPGKSFHKGLMRKIAATLTQISDTQVAEWDLKQELSTLGYFSVLKSLSPILLGLGIGIRLARTHYDVRVEEEKLKVATSSLADQIVPEHEPDQTA